MLFSISSLLSFHSSRVLSKHMKSSMKLSIPSTSATYFSKYVERPPITFTPNQLLYYNCLKNSTTDILFAVGPAGTGKTMIACNYAMDEFKKKNIDRIIITRPIITVPEEDLGFLPGKLQTKMQPWIQPILDIFQETYSKKQIIDMMEGGQIEICPLMHMRGRTFKNAIVIADEIQNTTPKQMYMLLSRCGKNCRMILTGDLNQSDLSSTNGLEDFIERYTTYEKEQLNQSSKPPIKVIFFNESDIQRSPIVNTVIEIYKKNMIVKPSPSPPPQPPPPVQPNPTRKYIDYTEVP